MKKKMTFIVSLLLLIGCSAFAQNVDTTRYIAMNVTQDSLITVGFSANAANTPVKIVCGDSVYLVTADINLISNGYHAPADMMIVYGDINYFTCDNNATKVTSLDVSNNISLEKLHCCNNSITSLNVNACASLKEIHCYQNNLTSLDVSACTALENLVCFGNSFSEQDYDDLMCSLVNLENRTTGTFQPIQNASDANLNTFANTNSANAKYKNWKVTYYEGGTIPATNGNFVCPVNMSRYITFNVIPDSTIKIAFMAETPNTAINIVSGDSNYNVIISDTSYPTTFMNFTAGDSTMIIYGNIKYFNCYENYTKITGLDASNNTELIGIDCYDNSLTTLNVNGCSKLTNLECYNNNLTLLNVTGCTSLETLYCSNNNLTTLDVSTCTALEVLNCFTNNLTSLDITNNNNLMGLAIAENPFTTESYDLLMCSLPMRNMTDSALIIPIIDTNDANYATFEATNASNATAKGWFVLDINFDSITTNGNYICGLNLNRYITLDVEQGKDIVIDVVADSNNTPFSIVSGTTNYFFYDTTSSQIQFTADSNVAIIYGDIQMLDCSNNDTNISGINIENNTDLVSLNVSNNNLTSLDVTKNIALTKLNCANNSITTINIENNIDLVSLNVSENDLTDLDVTKNIALEELYCENNQITTINIENNTNLVSLNVSNNNLTDLDVTKNIALLSLNINENNLTTLDVSNNTALKELYCASNSFTTQGYDDLMCSLPEILNQSGAFYPLIDANDANSTIFMESNSNNAIKKNWNVKYNDKTDIPTTNGKFVCGLIVDRYISLGVEVGKQISIDFTADEDYSVIKISNGNDDKVVLANKTWDEPVQFVTNSSTIEIYGKVKDFNCSYNGNNITSIDVSNNAELQSLDCSHNALNSLDVSNNTKLEYLVCDKNNLTTLNVENNTALINLICSENNISSLDVSKNTLLKTLQCNDNHLNSLDITNNTDLEYLYCDHNEIASLDVSNNTKLVYIYCENNKIAALDINNNTALNYLFCENNQISSLEISANTALELLSIYNNPFTTESYDNLMCSFPEAVGLAQFIPLTDSTDNNYSNFIAANATNATDKNWNVYYKVNNTSIATEGTFECINKISEIEMSNLKLYPNPAKTMLNIVNITDENVSIYDITGRLVISVQTIGQEEVSINISDLSEGMYFVKVGNHNAKFIKQ